MKKRKSSLSEADSYHKIGEFWDTHDLGDYWDSTEPVEMNTAIDSEAIYFPLEASISTKVKSIARHRGISAETLINLWIQEKLYENNLQADS